MKINAKPNFIKVIFSFLILFILFTFVVYLPTLSQIVLFDIVRIFILIFIIYIYRYYRNEYIIIEEGYITLKNGNRIKKRISLEVISSFSYEEEFIQRINYNEIDKLQIVDEKLEYFAINSNNGKKIILIKNLYNLEDINNLCDFCINKNNKIENLLISVRTS